MSQNVEMSIVSRLKFYCCLTRETIHFDILRLSFSTGHLFNFVAMLSLSGSIRVIIRNLRTIKSS